MICDNDRRFGAFISRVAFGTRIDVLRTPYRTPKANAIFERLLGSLQCECLDHLTILSQLHMYRIVKEYTRFLNYSRPHQGIDLQILFQSTYPDMPPTCDQVFSFPVLGGLHNGYQWCAA